MCRILAKDAGGANVCAFLDMLAYSEIGAPMLGDPRTDDGYKVIVGSTPMRMFLLQSYADHPRVRCSTLDSDAAGRYQILGRYWPTYEAQLGLLDFSPYSQDRYAIQQIKESRALAPIIAGDIEGAMRLCSRIWASLPGAPYGQHVNDACDLIAAYAQARGKYAT
jgi:muramidase (phage lysozyme)